MALHDADLVGPASRTRSHIRGVHFLGGRFEILSDPGVGTQVGVEIPIRLPAHEVPPPRASHRASA